MSSEGNSTTFRVSEKKPEKHHSYSDKKKSFDDVEIRKLAQYKKCKEVIKTSKFPTNTYMSNNGFVNTLVNAYNRHHNLVIRPDDVWAAIMTQFSFYINKHAEEFRGKFVNFEGKKQLTVSCPGSLRTAPYDLLVKLMTKEIDRNLVDPHVKQWILPNFSTTTDNDLVTVGVVFMATMKQYFDYGFMLLCGIPNVTLEGTLEDWQDIHSRLEKLKEYKLEKWYEMLEPVVKKFVNAKQGKVDIDFWQKIAHYEGGGSGPRYISGWVTVFCVFDANGNWQESKKLWYSEKEDKVEWLRIKTDDIPTGIVEVDVKVDDGTKYDCIMFAGHMGTEITNGGYTVQPTLGWGIALKSTSDEESKEKPESDESDESDESHE